MGYSCLGAWCRTFPCHLLFSAMFCTSFLESWSLTLAFDGNTSIAVWGQIEVGVCACSSPWHFHSFCPHVFSGASTEHLFLMLLSSFFICYGSVPLLMDSGDSPGVGPSLVLVSSYLVRVDCAPQCACIRTLDVYVLVCLYSRTCHLSSTVSCKRLLHLTRAW